MLLDDWESLLDLVAPSPLCNILTGNQIHTLSDLKALCLTSRAFHGYVIPKLYERVDVRLWNARNLAQFENSCNAGARPNFQHTRTLVFEDERLGPILDLEDHRILAVPQDDYDEPPLSSEEERLEKLANIVNLFPDHVLQRFWYVCALQRASLRESCVTNEYVV